MLATAKTSQVILQLEKEMSRVWWLGAFRTLFYALSMICINDQDRCSPFGFESIKDKWYSHWAGWLCLPPRLPNLTLLLARRGLVSLLLSQGFNL